MTTLCFEDRIVAHLALGPAGRPIELQYDPRWLRTPGAFPISRALPMTGTLYRKPRVAEWERGLSCDGVAPLEGALKLAEPVALFGALDLNDPVDAPPGPERRLSEAAPGEGALERIAFQRSLAEACGLALTPWRCFETVGVREIQLLRADRRVDGGRMLRLPLEIIAFTAAPLRSATQFRRLEGVLDAQDRLALFDRLAFAALIGAPAPVTALRLDGAPRLAPVGADWIGAPGAPARVALNWAEFALRAGMNPTFAPRRAAALAREMVGHALGAAETALAAAPMLDRAQIRRHISLLQERLAGFVQQAA